MYFKLTIQHFFKARPVDKKPKWMIRIEIRETKNNKHTYKKLTLQ